MDVKREGGRVGDEPTSEWYPPEREVLLLLL